MKQRYTYVVLTNAVEGREDEYNAWYTSRHLPDVLKLPGFVAAQRFRLADPRRSDPPFPYRYLALYEIETDDLEDTIDTLRKAVGTEVMPISDALSEERLNCFFQPITQRLQRRV